jgi:hypothetical protein
MEDIQRASVYSKQGSVANNNGPAKKVSMAKINTFADKPVAQQSKKSTEMKVIESNRTGSVVSAHPSDIGNR